MTKNTRSTERSNNGEVGELRELMQKVLSEVRTLAGEVICLKKLDQVVVELREQLAVSGKNRRGKTPMDHPEREEVPDARRVFDKRSQREKSSSSFTNHHSHFPRWSRMEFLRFFGGYLRS